MKKLIISLFFISSAYGNSYVERIISTLKWTYINCTTNTPSVATPGMPTVKKAPRLSSFEEILAIIFPDKKPHLYPRCFPHYKVTEESIVKLSFPL